MWRKIGQDFGNAALGKGKGSGQVELEIERLKDQATDHNTALAAATEAAIREGFDEAFQQAQGGKA